MKNYYFNQVTTLVMGLLIISSGKALSLSSDHKQLSNHHPPSNGELITAQENVSVSIAVAVAVKVLNQSVVVVGTVAKKTPVNIPSKYRDIVLPRLQQAQLSMAKAQSSSQKGDNAQVAKALSVAVSFMGEAQASAEADAGSVKAITNAIAKTNQALAIAQGQTKS